MTCDVFTKLPGTTRRITGDWATFMGTGVSILSVAYSAEAGITLGTPSKTATTETNFYSGGVDGQEYVVTITVTTDETPARIEDKKIIISVGDSC